jgi:hypothetical protein
LQAVITKQGEGLNPPYFALGFLRHISHGLAEKCGEQFIKEAIMANSTNNSPLNDAEVRRCLALLGPPPVLSSENAKAFEEMLYLSVAAKKPRNMLQVMSLHHSVSCSWIAMRYRRHGTMLIERTARQNQAVRVQRAKFREQRQAARESREVNKLTQGPPDVAKLMQLEDNFEAMIRDTDTTFDAADLERDHNKALYQTIGLQQQLNDLTESQMKMAHGSLQMYELTGMNLGEPADEVPANIIEGSCAEVKDPPAAPEPPSVGPSQEGNSAVPNVAGEPSTNGGA